MTTGSDEPQVPTDAEWRVRLDAGRCVANGMCASIAPEIFDLDPEGEATAVILPVIRDADLLELAREAEESCPAAAILVEEADGAE